MLTINMHSTLARPGPSCRPGTPARGLNDAAASLACLFVRCLDERQALRLLGTSDHRSLASAAGGLHRLRCVVTGILFVLAIIGSLLAFTIGPSA